MNFGSPRSAILELRMAIIEFCSVYFSLGSGRQHRTHTMTLREGNLHWLLNDNVVYVEITLQLLLSASVARDVGQCLSAVSCANHFGQESETDNSVLLRKVQAIPMIQNILVCTIDGRIIRESLGCKVVDLGYGRQGQALIYQQRRRAYQSTSHD